jgi:hypothetical protein
LPATQRTSAEGAGAGMGRGAGGESRGRWSSAALFALVFMSFSYTAGANPAIDYPRLLVSDTQQFAPDGITRAYIFEDSEITAAMTVISSMWQSAQFFGVGGVSIFPTTPSQYLRTAATLLNALAANNSRLAAIKQLLDVKVDATDAAIQLRETAQMYLDMDDNSGAFAIIEMVNDDFSFRDRFWKQVQRQSAGGFIP